MLLCIFPVIFVILFAFSERSILMKFYETRTWSLLEGREKEPETY